VIFAMFFVPFAMETPGKNGILEILENQKM
jgi:hypothetical protein